MGGSPAADPRSAGPGLAPLPASPRRPPAPPASPRRPRPAGLAPPALSTRQDTLDPVRKVLVANRGEIAVRAFRAINELGYTSVAVFPYEDRYSLHRQKADESYEIGERGHPLRAYLDIPGLIEVAEHCGADAIYPGYGFLSENPELARACEEAGITFVGPPARVLALAGNKVAAKQQAEAAGIPVLASAGPWDDVDDLVAAGVDIGYPLFVKAAAGGGGRGLRRVAGPDDLRAAVEAATREAATAFGDPTVFLEAAVEGSAPRRGTGARRRRRRRRPPLREGLLGPTTPSEGGRDCPGAQPRPRH